jgi:hypothetical protein
MSGCQDSRFGFCASTTDKAKKKKKKKKKKKQQRLTANERECSEWSRMRQEPGGMVTPLLRDHVPTPNRARNDRAHRAATPPSAKRALREQPVARPTGARRVEPDSPMWLGQERAVAGFPRRCRPDNCRRTLCASLALAARWLRRPPPPEPPLAVTWA